MTKSIFVVTLLYFLPATCFAELAKVQIDGSALPPNTVIITYDEVYENWQSGESEPRQWTLAIMEYLASVERQDSNGYVTLGVPVAQFFPSCHFSTQPPSDPRGVMCMGARDVEDDLIFKLILMGHVVGNHTHSHLSASSISPEDFIRELSQTQYLLDKYQIDGFHLYRAPGLDFPNWAADVVNADPYLRKLQGPIGVDVGGTFVIGDQWMGGDWDCPSQGFSPEQCGDLYLRDIREVTKVHGAIVLLHNYVIPGWYAFRLIHHIMENLDVRIKAVDIRTHPALRLRALRERRIVPYPNPYR